MPIGRGGFFDERDRAFPIADWQKWGVLSLETSWIKFSQPLSLERGRGTAEREVLGIAE